MDPAELALMGPIVASALAEDLHAGDVTARATVPEGALARARIVARQELVLAGRALVQRVFDELAGGHGGVVVRWAAADGDRVPEGAAVASLEGSARTLVAGERVALNLLQRSCAVATLTRRYVDAAGGRCRIADTRKTMPGLRALDRYAVRCGGGHNHRNDLGAGVLIKENHIRVSGGVAAAVGRARAQAPHTMRIACEVTDLEELDAAIVAGAEVVLLDNMSDDMVRAAVERVAGRAVVEVSGGVRPERVPHLAQLGVDVISVGALTHSAPAVDLSMLMEIAPADAPEREA